MASLEIRRTYPGDQISGKYNGVATIGTPMGAHATLAETFDLADGTNFLGFTRQEMTAAGPTLADHVFGESRGELPATQSGYVALELADEVDVGDEFLKLSSTGALSGGSPPGTLLSFDTGKFYEAQSGDHSFYQLTEQLTPESGETVRIRCNRI